MTTANTEALMGAIALVGIGVCTATLIALHLLPTGLSPLRNPVSQYGITKYKFGYRIQTIAMGIAAIAAAIGINKVAIQGCTTVVIILTLFGAARLIISWFPMDDPSSERTVTGRRHGLLAIAAFAGASIGALRLGNILSRASVWGSSATAITCLGIIMIASIIGMGVVRRGESGRRYFGLVERVFYAAAISFLTVVGAQLLTAK